MEQFHACLKRCLEESGLTASEAARLVGFKSRNSIFRILQGETRPEVNARFLDQLQGALADAWPPARWEMLREALEYDRMGPEAYGNRQAFGLLLSDAPEQEPPAVVQTMSINGDVTEEPLADLLRAFSRFRRVEAVITGCCTRAVMDALLQSFEHAAQEGRLTVRHYIDVTEDVVVRNILGVLPLLNKPWYNARLVGPDSCPRQMMQLYRLHALYITCWDEAGRAAGNQMTCIDEGHFVRRIWRCPCPSVQILDRWRFHLELLKPPLALQGDMTDYLRYTEQYGKLEERCTILSIKPDVHFNAISPRTLYASVMGGFQEHGLAEGEALRQLMDAMWKVHEARYNNLLTKRKPTHLIYSRPAMERFMRTGMLADHFFMQRPYSPAERREIIRDLRDCMLQRPWFNVHFLKTDVQPGKEVSLYGDKGVMIMDAHTSYELGTAHSEAFITLPAFREAFRECFMNSLLTDAVYSRAENLQILDQLMVIPGE